MTHLTVPIAVTCTWQKYCWCDANHYPINQLTLLSTSSNEVILLRLHFKVKKNKLTWKHTVQHRYEPRSDQILADQKPRVVSGLVQRNQLSPPKVGNDKIISVPETWNGHRISSFDGRYFFPSCYSYLCGWFLSLIIAYFCIHGG